MSGAGGNDRLADVFGRDHFLGGAGNDVFICRASTSDSLNNPDTVSAASAPTAQYRRSVLSRWVFGLDL